jgi:hypothetical protein
MVRAKMNKKNVEWNGIGKKGKYEMIGLNRSEMHRGDMAFNEMDGWVGG